MASPQTPFEQRGAAVPWTTVTEEAAFIAALGAASPKVRVETWGHSVQGTPIRALVLGTGPSVILHVALQHANEASTRESMLAMVRDLAFSTDPDVLAYLQAATVVVIPTANPDSHPTARANKNSADLNRDHVKLTQPETRAVHRAIHHYDPDILIDWHESDGQAGSYGIGGARSLNADPVIRTRSNEVRDVGLAALVDAGFTIATYPDVSGPEMLTGCAIAQSRVSIIPECEMESPADHSDAGLRHQRNLILANAIRVWHLANVEAIHNDVRDARRREAQGMEPVTLHSLYDVGGPRVDPLPRGYVVGAADWDALAIQREVFGIVGWPSGEGVYLPTNQLMQTLVVYLLDETSPQRVVSGERWGLPPPAQRIGRRYTLRFRHNGVTYPATLKVKA